MKTIRHALGNGLLRSGIAVSLAYLLLLQSLLAGMAEGALVTARAGALPVICTSRGPDVPHPAVNHDIPVKPAPHRHCATLCQVASAGALAVLGAQAGIIAAPRQQGVAVSFTPREVTQSVAIGLIPEARAPPSSI